MSELTLKLIMFSFRAVKQLVCSWNSCNLLVKCFRKIMHHKNRVRSLKGQVTPKKKTKTKKKRILSFYLRRYLTILIIFGVSCRVLEISALESVDVRPLLNTMELNGAQLVVVAKSRKIPCCEHYFIPVSQCSWSPVGRGVRESHTVTIDGSCFPYVELLICSCRPHIRCTVTHEWGAN